MPTSTTIHLPITNTDTKQAYVFQQEFLQSLLSPPNIPPIQNTDGYANTKQTKS